MTCWCGERRNGTRKHRRRQEGPCDASLEAARAYDRARDRRGRHWTAGAPVLVPEVDPL